MSTVAVVVAAAAVVAVAVMAAGSAYDPNQTSKKCTAYLLATI